MALVAVSTTELAVLPKASGGTVGIYLLAYNSNVAAAAASEPLTPLINGGAVTLGLPRGSTVLAWENAAIATTALPGAAGDASIIMPLLDQAAQTLQMVSANTGAVHAGGTLGTILTARAIVIAQQD